METVVGASGAVEIRELLPGPNPKRLTVPLDLAGPGIAEVYAILADVVLRNARVVGVEEPEAHLHGPSSGEDLREALKALVEKVQIDQLFIATHSNLFDLDPRGYRDVSLEPGKGTVVRRASLDEVDQHFYEPGPAKRALRAQKVARHLDLENLPKGTAELYVERAEAYDLLKELNRLGRLKEPSIIDAPAVSVARVGRPGPSIATARSVLGCLKDGR
ncbi:MAG: hypothetical protein U1F43_19280 [Myxococcota bacterium]